MEHVASKIKVYMTEDYKRFSKIDGNRPINKKKIANIIEEINAGNDVLAECPVLVKELNQTKLEILDGQHRFEVSKQLKRPVHYIVKKQEMNLYNIAKVNSNTEKWKAEDFINCYVKAGNKDYEIIDQFHKQYKAAVGVCLSMLHHGGLKADFGAAANLVKEFETGIYKVKKYKEAVQLIEICKSFEPFEAWNSRNFIVAISKILAANKCELDVLLRKLKADPSKLQKQADWRKYLVNLEEIYNIGNSKRRVIYE